MKPMKLAKNMRIFVEIEHIESYKVTIWPKRIGAVFPTPWSGHEVGHKILTTSQNGKYQSDAFGPKCEVLYLHKYSYRYS